MTRGISRNNGHKTASRTTAADTDLATAAVHVQAAAATLGHATAAMRTCHQMPTSEIRWYLRASITLAALAVLVAACAAAVMAADLLAG